LVPVARQVVSLPMLLQMDQIQLLIQLRPPEAVAELRDFILGQWDRPRLVLVVLVVAEDQILLI